MSQPLYQLEPARSETFPYPEKFARGVSSVGPVCYFDAGVQADLLPVVLIHALGTNFTLWEYVAPELARHTRVVGLDLPGCGHSAKPRRTYSLHMMSQAVLGLMNQLGLKRAVLVGHSFGGRIAADVALHHPERVGGLVLMNSSGFTRFPLHLHVLGRVFFRPTLVAPLIQRGINSVMSRIFAAPNERTERFIRQVVERPDSRYAWEFAHYACPMIGDLMSHVLDRLDELHMPTLVIWGDRDGLLKYEDVSSWTSRLPAARLLMLRNCGHMPNIEQPEAVNEAVLQHLREIVGYRSLKAQAR